MNYPTVTLTAEQAERLSDILSVREEFWDHDEIKKFHAILQNPISSRQVYAMVRLSPQKYIVIAITGDTTIIDGIPCEAKIAQMVFGPDKHWSCTQELIRLTRTDQTKK